MIGIPLTVGSAQADITPRADVPAALQQTTAVPCETPLQARALAFQCGGAAAALVGVDLCVLGAESSRRIGEAVAATTPIPAAHLMLAASHTHSGPSATRWLGLDFDAGYLAWAEGEIAAAVCRAWEGRRPASVGTGQGLVGLAVNRWVESENEARWGVAWDAPTDNSVTVVRFDSDAGLPLAAVVNFAAHASVMSFGGSRRYSADYPGFLREYLEGRYPGLVTAFTNGASGDLKIAYVDDEGRQFRYGDVADARRYGYCLGAEAAAALQRARPREVASLSVASQWCDLPLLAPPSREELLREIEKPEFPKCGDVWARAMLAELQRGPLPRSVRAQVQVLRIGEAATLLAFPGELFAEIGLRLKRELTARYPGLCIVGYANGYAGYLPAARSVRLDGARPRYNWQKFVGTPAVYAAEAEEVLVAAAHAALAAASVPQCQAAAAE